MTTKFLIVRSTLLLTECDLISSSCHCYFIALLKNTIKFKSSTQKHAKLQYKDGYYQKHSCSFQIYIFMNENVWIYVFYAPYQ